MPRIARGQNGLHTLHVLNRGNARAQVFHDPSDYRAFIRLLGEAKERAGVELFAFCLMPNHFHLVARPREEGALSDLMQWWMTSFVRRTHRRRDSSGHVWQGRFKSFPVQHDEHLLTVLRYVLLNPVRGGLCESAGEWPWSSLHFASVIDPWPVKPAEGTHEWLARGVREEDAEAIRKSIRRRTPYGDPDWTEQVAKESGLPETIRPRGRPSYADSLSLDFRIDEGGDLLT